VRTFILLMLLFVVTACGQNPADIITGGEPPKVEGINVSVVGDFSGLVFESESFDGVITNGTFKCKISEQVDFYLSSNTKLHDIYVGTFYCQSLVSPMELVTWNRFSVNTPISDLDNVYYVGTPVRTQFERWLRIMYLLDSDQDPSNGITILRSQTNLFSQTFSNNPFHPDQIFGNTTSSPIVNNVDFETFITNIEYIFNRSVLTTNEALSEFEDMRVGCTPSGCNSRLY